MPETSVSDTSSSPTAVANTTPTPTPTPKPTPTTTTTAAAEYISQEHPERGRDPDLEDEQASLLQHTGPTREPQYPQGNNTGSTVNGSGSRQSHVQGHHIMDNLFRFSLPTLPSSQAIRTAGVYVAGGLFSLGFWFFIDAAVYSKVNNLSDIHIKFVDWIPGICSALGMLVINSIEKSRLNADSFSYSGSDVAWKARLVLFLGFALMAGGLAGSVVVLVIKYIVEHYDFEIVYFGIANVIANGLIMLSSIVLWVSQNMEDDYAYHLTLS